MDNSIKSEICSILINQNPKDKRVKIFDLILFTLISLSILSLILETDQTIDKYAGNILFWFEVVVVIAFTIEYALRIWCCTSIKKYTPPVLGRIKYALTPLMLVDLLAILPFYTSFLCDDFLFLRIFRLTKIFFRLIKLTKHSPGINNLISALKRTRRELTLSVLVFIIIVIMTASVMYMLEKDLQPEVFSSIPQALYWTVITFTTVGYGDICPVTSLGKFIAAISGIIGVIMFAVPTAILFSAMVDEFRIKKQRISCHNCNGNLTDILTGQFVHDAHEKDKAIYCPLCGEKLSGQ